MSALPIAATGCQTTVTSTPAPASRYVLSAPRPAAAKGVAATILPVGSVPYDHRSLALVSPSGVFVATQAGVAPEWPTLLASAGATVPVETGVVFYAVDRERGETRKVGICEEPLLLGRGGDTAGVLVESPRADGARWIGRIPWTGGPVTWLLDDDRVNAFACAAGDGRLAWSRRSVSATHFDLVVRTAGGEEWVIGAQGGDWLHPVLAGDDGLFALRLVEGRLEIAFMHTGDMQQMRSSLVTLHIADDATAATAYQVLASQALMQDVPRHDSTHLVFWHPRSQRMAIWRPTVSAAAATLLEPASVAACIDPAGRALVGSADHLALQDPANEAQRRVLVPGPQVPRAINDPAWTHLLLAPGADGIGLMLFRIEGG